METIGKILLYLYIWATMTTTNNEYVSEKVKDSYTVAGILTYKSTGCWAKAKDVIEPNVG